MNVPEPENDQELEALLTETFGPPPVADIGVWRQRYPAALAWLNPQRIGALSQRRKYMQRIILSAAAAAAAVCAWLGLAQLNTSGTGASAFAQTVQQLEKAKTITWKATSYEHATSRDGKATWLVARTYSRAYKSPGLWRDDHENSVVVDDGVRGKRITLLPEKKKAIVVQRQPIAVNLLRSPFDQFQEILKDGNLQRLESRTLPTGKVVNVFRNTERDEDNKRYRSYDFWIDAESKSLVKVCIPGPDGKVYDPEKDPIRNNPPGEQAYSLSAVGAVWFDIVFDAKIDDSLFSLQPPDGYAVEHQGAPRVTERNMLEYLGAFAEFNDQTFPDKAFPHENYDKLNAALKKPDQELTAIEKKYLALFRHYSNFGSSPFNGFFLGPDVVEESFRYVGKGVKLGDGKAIVCWYKLKEPKVPNTYRVVYGDLSVKDAQAKDLPLPVER